MKFYVHCSWIWIWVRIFIPPILDWIKVIILQHQGLEIWVSNYGDGDGDGVHVTPFFPFRLFLSLF